MSSPALNSQFPIDAGTKLYGILGNPIGHSLSPFLHNALFQKRKINAVYLAFQVEVHELGMALESVRALGMGGVNITIPFKESAMNLMDEIPEDIDRMAGAINTVVNRRGKLYGYNTDGPGFLIALKEELDFAPTGKNMLVIGAGGAARGVVFALAHARAKKIWVLNRTAPRAAGLAELAETHFPKTDLESPAHEGNLSREKIDLVVNATSCGMTPPPFCAIAEQSARAAGEKGGGVKPDEIPFDLRTLKTKPAVYDLVYTPRETPFLKLAKSLGLPNAGGLGMLAAQAALSFELWTGVKENVREDMKELIQA